MNKITVVVGGQYGSECKGAVCARLHRERRGMLAVRVGGSQAGHTVYDDQGRRWALRHVPVAAVVDPGAALVIGQGSEIDLGVLYREIADLEAAGFTIRERLHVDQEATVIEDKHKAEEQRGLEAGSTRKGVGAARAARAMRTARRIKDFMPTGFRIRDTAAMLNKWSKEGILIEGVQGYGLGSHAGAYPYATSSDCRAIDFMAMAGLAPQSAEVWMVIRPYPIRIAGDSGPLEQETSWEALGLEPEITTVTRKTRRVGGWDQELVERAVAANGGSGRVKIAFMQLDYLWTGVREATTWEQLIANVPRDVLAGLLDRLGKLGNVAMFGTGPQTQIMMDMDAWRYVNAWMEVGEWRVQMEGLRVKTFSKRQTG